MRSLSHGLRACLLTTVLAAGAGAAELRGHGGPVRALAVDGAGRVLTGSFDTSAILWDLETGVAQAVMRLHTGGVNAVAFLADGRLATGGQDGRVGIWQAGATEPDTATVSHGGPVSALTSAPDGRIASSGWDGRVIVTGAQGVLVLEGHDGPVNAAAFLPGGGLVSAGYDQTLRFWSADGTRERTVTLATQLNALAVSADGEVWVAGADAVLRAFDAAGVILVEIGVGTAPLAALAPSPDQTRLAVGAMDGSIAVVDRGRRSTVVTLSTGAAPVWSLAFDPTGAEVLAGGADGVVRAWNAATGAALGSTPRAAEPLVPGDSRGARVFRACAACHTLGPGDGNRAGPSLHGLFGRRIGSAAGYDYSAALAGMDIIWTPETVAALFEVGPNAYTPGTKMPEQRITSPEDRAALTEFLAERTR